MRLTFPIATIASISGVAFLSTSTSHQVAASVSISSQPSDASVSFKSLSTSHGNECLFVNAFEKQEIHADVGILSCAADEICVEDAKSSVGGRCMALTDLETSAKSQRELVACTFADGTAGVKCEGDRACKYVDESSIGCGSCIGDEACFKLKAGTTIGKNSCVAFWACREGGGSVGDNSCRGIHACQSASGNNEFSFLSSNREFPV